MEDKMPQAIVPGLYGVIGGAANAYVIDAGPGGVTAIDAGLAHNASGILDLVRRIGRQPRDVANILVTHADIDHIGGLKVLHAATGAAIIAGVDSVPYIERPRNPPHVKPPLNVFAGVWTRLRRGTAPVSQAVTDGDVLDIAGGIRVLATPGHTPEHMSYYWERERVLFAGDLLNTLGGTLRLTQPRITWDMAAAQASVRKVAALRPAVIVCGHGAVWRAEADPGRLEALVPPAGADDQAK